MQCNLGSGRPRAVRVHILSQDNDDSHASSPETEHTTGVSGSFVHVIAKMILVSGYSRKKECKCFNLTQNKRN